MINISALSATELDQLIAQAAERRANMTPGFTDEPPQQGLIQHDPKWWMSLNDTRETVMRFRHDGFGWVNFVIPPNERAHMLSVLLHQALFTQPANVPNIPSAGSGGGTVH